MKIESSFESQTSPEPQGAVTVSGPRPEAAASSAACCIDTPIPRLAYTIRETAAMLAISEKSVRRLILRGLIRPSRALRHLLIPKKEIDRFLDETSIESKL